MFKSWILILPSRQRLYGFEDGGLVFIYPVSTAKNGLGEREHSECTPRGWHAVHSVIGLDAPLNSIFVARKWTGECYTKALKEAYPERDFILTRIIRLEGLEPGFNQGGEVDTFSRYIYIHGTPEPMRLNYPASHGCIRMRNRDVMALAEWVQPHTPIYIRDEVR